MRSANEELIPHARRVALVTSRLQDEVLVYDKQRDKAFCLNESAAFIWKQCDGRRTIGEVARAAEQELGTPFDAQAVWLALEQLGKYHLLETKLARPTGATPLSRRDLIRLGFATAAALPLVTAIVAPTAASAQSAISQAQCQARMVPNCGGTPCSTGGTCQQQGSSANCRCQ